MLSKGGLVGSTACLRITPFLKKQHDRAHALNTGHIHGHKPSSMVALA